MNDDHLTPERVADYLQKLADDVRSGELEVAGLSMNVDHGRHSSIYKDFYFRKNPVTIVVRVNVKAFQKEEEEALMQALTASGRSLL